VRFIAQTPHLLRWKMERKGAGGGISIDGTKSFF
jgi:hypothetical protein